MKPVKGKVLKRYIVSYLAVALTVCLVLGLALTLAANGQLLQAEIDLYHNRLTVAANSIENQIDLLEDIRLSVKTGRTYQPFILRSSIVNDLGLIEDFSRYASYSSWVSEYYLWYLDAGKVYGRSSSYTSDVFLNHIMGGLTREQIEPLLKPAGGVNIGIMRSRPDALTLCLPFYFGTSKFPAGDCALVVLVKINTLSQSVWDTTGAQWGAPFTLRYNGQRILGGEGDSNDLLAYGDDQVVSLSMNTPDISSFDRLIGFERINWGIIIAVGLAGIALAVYAAWHSYKPIRLLYGKYVIAGKGSGNELQTIEELLNATLKRNILSQRQLEDQMAQLGRQRTWLKQQLVMMLIADSESPVVQRQIQEMGLEMAHSHFAILFLRLSDGGEMDSLLKSIEDFSDDDCSFYAAELHADRECAVLVSFDEEDQLADIPRLLEDALTARKLTAQLQMSGACDRLGDIASAAIEALSAPAATLPDDSSAPLAEDGFDQLVAMIEAGNAGQAQAQLEALIAVTKTRYPSYLMRVYMLNRLSQRLTVLAYQAGVAVPEYEGNGLRDHYDISQYLRRVVKTLCADAQVEPPADQTGGEAAAYVREHFLDANLSLTSTAQALNVSTKQVTRLLRASVDRTFKEYLLQLRMKAAQDFLREGLSIAETAKKVGYFNISHFIKCFKEYVGTTPGEWKKYAGRQAGGSLAQ